MINKAIGLFFKIERERFGFTQGQVSTHLRLNSSSAMSNLELGKREWTYCEVVEALAFFGVSNSSFEAFIDMARGMSK